MEPKPVSKFVAAFVLAASFGSASHAADKSRYSLLNPTPDALLRDMSTDRPDKTESPYTVDAGRFQIETDLVAYTHDSRDGITTRTLYRFVDQGDLPAYRMGRVIRLKASDIDAFIESSRIEPGTLEHLYPDTSPKG